MNGEVELPVDGDYTIYLRGSVGRPVSVSVDGKKIGSVKWEEAYPGNYMPLGLHDLKAGIHRIHVARGGGSPLPGTGNEIGSASTTGLVGPLAFLPSGQEKLVTVSKATRPGALRGRQDAHGLDGDRREALVTVDPGFWKGRRVLVTGHTGFKGAWLTLWLQSLGAQVAGLSDAVPTSPSLFEAARVADGIADVRADVRDGAAVDAAFAEHAPEVVIHMAAQSLVRRSYRDPRTTYATNVMGTVNVLEAARTTPSVLAVVNVTSDKSYDNRELRRAFVETDPMGGHDPYSSSKGAAELVASAYLRSFDLPLASARAGNVIGGGDFSEDRLVADIARSAMTGAPIPIRSPQAVRPWQHVLNPLAGYLELAQRLGTGETVHGGWNFGPDPEDVRTVLWLAERLTEMWPGELRWEIDPGPHPHEAAHLALDSAKARSELGWQPAWDLAQALQAIVAWYVAFAAGEDVRAVTLDQIERFSTLSAR